MIIFEQNFKYSAVFRQTAVVGQQKEKNGTCANINMASWNMYQHRYTDDVYHKQLFDQFMTYIVTGKFKNKTFLMTDCVGTTPNGEHMFCNKLVKLKSTKNETYSTITGYDTFQTAINLFDVKCYENDIIFDIENENHINEILEIYEHLKNNLGYDIEKDFLFSGLFFIEKDKICYHIIKMDENNKMYVRGKKYITNNMVVEDMMMTFDMNDNIYDDNNEIIKYCKKAIIRHYKRKKETKNLDLKDKFSFIMFNGDEKIKILPYQNNEEMVLSIIGCKYEKTITEPTTPYKPNEKNIF